MKSLFPMTAEQKLFVEREILRCVESAYESWKKYGVQFGQSEPKITIGYLFGWFESNVGWGGASAVHEYDDYRLARAQISRERRRLVWATAERLRKQGKLLSSIGISESGHEARCYEPSYK